MKIALIGYGKMGKTIEQIAIERGNEISYKIDVTNKEDLKRISPENTDVAIEFTRPDSAFENIQTLINQNVKVISGTTGWLEKYTEIEGLVKAIDGTFLYASNFSLGVNLFFKLNEQLAKMMVGRSYKPSMEEIHHTQKLDAPSGTAITLAEGVIKNTPGVKSWVNEASKNPDSLGIISLREDEVPGTHTVTYDSEIDSIEIKHTAHTRKGFALGAVLVAEWISDKKGVLSMSDFFGF